MRGKRAIPCKIGEVDDRAQVREGGALRAWVKAPTDCYTIDPQATQTKAGEGRRLRSIASASSADNV
jgi:hypothetical protein